MTRDECINEVLERGIASIYPSRESFENVLRTTRRLVVYHGIDPTGPQLHLGHSTNLFTLRLFQELGHRVILLIGDLTARIGDPTDKYAMRKPLQRAQVLKYAKRYRAQVGRILAMRGPNPARIVFQSSWYRRFHVEDFLALAQRVTVQRLLERDMFQKRLHAGKPIGVHEFVYPLFQGYDSVALRADVEVGGSDQTFNMLMGRTLVREIVGKEKFVLTTTLLENPKTHTKLMSKSEGGIIGLNESPNDMYGKIMALPDEVILPCFTLCTRLSRSDIVEISQQIKHGGNPRDAKMRLAREITTLYHSDASSRKAENQFVKVFQKKGLPSHMPEVGVPGIRTDSVNFLVESGILSSKSEARRLIKEGGVRINGKKVDLNTEIQVSDGSILQLGKRRFFRLRLTSDR